ncbi:hypothetical protein, partial [Burkholderia glumae]|uniref:hypothetical protein n=1 Tax=Burkholderia glumae TaxID=337 RepID=UPI001E52D386
MSFLRGEARCKRALTACVTRHRPFAPLARRRATRASASDRHGQIPGTAPNPVKSVVFAFAAVDIAAAPCE